jgi:hypothetical protein
MKNLLFAAIALLMVGAVSSCTKTQTETVEPGTANVTLHLRVNNDETNTSNGNTIWENIPTGTVVTFIIDSEDLQYNPNSSYSYDDIIQTATVDANSDVTIELPAIATAYNVIVKFPDLEMTRTYDSGGTTMTETEVYEKSDLSVSVWDGAQEYRTVTYAY